MVDRSVIIIYLTPFFFLPLSPYFDSIPHITMSWRFRPIYSIINLETARFQSCGNHIGSIRINKTRNIWAILTISQYLIKRIYSDWKEFKTSTLNSKTRLARGQTSIMESISNKKIINKLFVVWREYLFCWWIKRRASSVIFFRAFAV